MTASEQPVIPEDLRELYGDCVADDSRASRTTTSGFMAELIRRLAKSKEWANRLSEELDKGDSWAWIREKFEKCRTQFRWYTPREDSLAGTRYEVMGWLHVLFAHADPEVYINITIEHQKKADDAEQRAARAESAVAELRAENERLKADASWAATHRSELADLRDAFAKAETANAELQRTVELLKVRKPKGPVVYEREGGDIMDRECIPICDALNLLPGIETISSCCGHGYAPFRIYFKAQWLDDLKPILELIDESEFWTLRSSMATGNMEIYFVLDGLQHDSIFIEANKLAEQIAARAQPISEGGS